MNSNLFHGSHAWFSSSVSAQLKKKWEDYGGLIVDSFQDVDYIFSSNAGSEDTRRAFQAIRGTGLLVFRPKWIGYAVKVSGNKQLTPLGIERFILFPHFVDKDILGDAGEERGDDDDWIEFEADLVSSSSPSKLYPNDDLKKNPSSCGKPIIHSTLIETPTKIRKINRQSFRNNLLPESSTSTATAAAANSSERRKPKIRYNCLTTPRSAASGSVKSARISGAVAKTKTKDGAIACDNVNSDTIVGVLGDRTNHVTNKSATVDFNVERPAEAQKIARVLKTTTTTMSRSNNAATATPELHHEYMDEITCYDVISQLSQSSVADLNGSFRALSTSQQSGNESSQPQSPPLCLADIMCAKHQKTIAQSNARYKKICDMTNKENKENEAMEVDVEPKGTPCGGNTRKGARMATRVDSEKRGVLLPRPIITSPLKSEKKRKATKSERKASTSAFQTPSDIGTPSTVRKKRKLYRKASDSYLDSEAGLIAESTRRRSAEEHLSPVDIHELLNSDENEVYLCGKKVAAAGCRNDDYMITPSRSQTLKSCKDIMQKHKATVELKRNGYEGGERFAKGSNTGFLHLDTLDIPDIMLEDFVINRAGCRVELIKR